MTNSDLFKAPETSGDETNEDIDYVKELVGEGKKFKEASPEELLKVLAKSKYEADRHIQNLEQEQNELRQELNTRLKLEELMKTLSEPKAPEASKHQNNEDGGERRGDPNKNSEVDIEKTVEALLNSRLEAQHKQNNVAVVKDELTKRWGKQYLANVDKVLSETGMSREQFADLAATNPKVVLALADKVAPSQSNPNDPLLSAPRSTQRIVGSPQSSNEKNFKFYEKIRKENPRRYFSPEVQGEMHRMARQMGDDFYK